MDRNEIKELLQEILEKENVVLSDEQIDAFIDDVDEDGDGRFYNITNICQCLFLRYFYI